MKNSAKKSTKKVETKKETTVLLRFSQDTKNGEKVLQGQEIKIDSIGINEVVGTIVKMVTDVREMVHNKQIKLSGFSFNRKFEMGISIDGRDYVSLGDSVANIFGKEQANASRKTWIITDDEDKNKDTFTKFCADVLHVVSNDMLNQGEIEVLTLDEAKEEVFGAKYLNA